MSSRNISKVSSTNSANRSINKRSSRFMGFKSTRELGKRTMSIGNRASMAFSRISTRFLSSAPDIEGIRQARLSFTTFFRDIPSESEILFNELAYFRVIKLTDDNTIPKRYKFKGRVMLGCGRVYLDMDLVSMGDNIDKKVKWSFDIGMIKNLRCKRDTSKDCYIAFLHNGYILNILFKKPDIVQTLLQRIFFEAKVQAQCFHKLMLKTINTVWYKALKIGLFDEITPQVQLTSSEKQQLVMTERELDLIEVCLRNEVDFWRMSRGESDEEVFQSIERLAIFLKNTIRVDESKYWFEQYESSKKQFHEKSSNEILRDAKVKDMIEHLRNPPGLEAQHIVITNKKLMSHVDYKQRLNEIITVINAQNAGTYEPVDSDPFFRFFNKPTGELVEQTLIPSMNRRPQKANEDISKFV